MEQPPANPSPNCFAPMQPAPAPRRRLWNRLFLLAALVVGVAIMIGSVLRPAPVAAPAGLGELRQPRILVEKSLHRVTVFDGDRVVRVYRAAVGGGKGDKTREGDRCTPEGDFYVCLKNPQSKYVLSLGLSYPNRPHAQRGLRDGLITQQQYDSIIAAIDAGEMPDWYTPLGGEIMIHGCGAGRDWTAGCVALDDDAIRELYPAVPLRTPVRIIP
jgi:lipoprotein-anchoring transpeptidase ErfK/SrfK